MRSNKSRTEFPLTVLGDNAGERRRCDARDVWEPGDVIEGGEDFTRRRIRTIYVDSGWMNVSAGTRRNFLGIGTGLPRYPRNQGK